MILEQFILNRPIKEVSVSLTRANKIVMLCGRMARNFQRFGQPSSALGLIYSACPFSDQTVAAVSFLLMLSLSHQRHFLKN